MEIGTGTDIATQKSVGEVRYRKTDFTMILRGVNTAVHGSGTSSQPGARVLSRP